MAQSQNTKVDFTAKATSFQGLGVYGDILIGDKAFEFYNEKNPEDYIQIPWDQITHVDASLLFGKKINRFAIFTMENGHFSFSCRDNFAALRAIRVYVGQDNVLKSPGFFQVLARGFLVIGSKLFRK